MKKIQSLIGIAYLLIGIADSFWTQFRQKFEILRFLSLVYVLIW